MSKYKFSEIAENLSQISVSAISNEIDKRISEGEEIIDLTVGDFNPNYFPIPKTLKEEIIKAYHENHTNYGHRGNIDELLAMLSKYIKKYDNLDYKPEEFVMASGARPLIYTLFQILVDPGDKVIYPVPSWNNHNYVQLSKASPIVINTDPENNFMPTAQDIEPHIKDAVMIVFNSPLNPTGTSFDRKTLREIFELLATENKRRRESEKPLYIIFDAVYRALNESNTIANILDLVPEIRDYVIFVDAISKCFAATGLRVGWAFGPHAIIDKITSILSHFGAWAPKPEQVGLARFLANESAVDYFLYQFRDKLLTRLNILYEASQNLKQMGYKIDAIKPSGSLYLSLKLDIKGMKTNDGKILHNVDDILIYLIKEAKIAIIPFYIFGADKNNSSWFRLSVGNCSVEEINKAAENFKKAVKKLNY